VTRDDRKLGRFRDDAARRRFMTAYDDALTFWPCAPEHLDVATRFGTTHVLRSGSAEGTPIVLLHAVAVASPMWFANVGALGEHHPVYAIDTIGDVGRSLQTAAIPGAADLAVWLDDALTALGRDRVHLVGLSYGGWLVLNQALRAPDRLAGITSIDPPGAFGRPKASFVASMVPDGFLAKFVHSDPALHRLLARLNDGVPPAPPLLGLSVAGLRTFRARQPFPARLKDDELRRIRTPALLLFGERSPVNRASSAAQRARQFIANAHAEVISGAGHMLPVQMPDLFARRVLRFVDEIDERERPLP